MLRHFIPYIYIILFFLVGSSIIAQELQLKLRSHNLSEQKILDSIPYKIKHSDTTSIYTEVETIQNKLERNGFLGTRLIELSSADTIYTAHFTLGDKTSRIQLSYAHDSLLGIPEVEMRKILDLDGTNTIDTSFENLPAYLQEVADELERTGRSFIKVKLSEIELNGNLARAELNVINSKKRTIDKIVIRGYENFPKNFVRHELGLQVGSAFNKSKLNRASLALGRIPFAQQARDPEVLFTNDSTIIYLYLKKSKSNRFDGILGFASKEESSGLEFNGYLDLAVNNIFNSGETIAIYWKNNGNDRQRFYLQAETPYLFNTPLTPLFNFELYRQDSTFNNVTAKIDLNYRISLRSMVAASFRTETSSDLGNSTSSAVKPYSNQFFGGSYQLNDPTRDPIFLQRYEIYIEALFGSRKIDDSGTTSQTRFVFKGNYLWPIDERNHIFIQNQSGLLNSTDYYDNELFRIGGINNLRGVNEESIFASGYSVFNLEYRFKPTENSYFYTISDFALIENQVLPDSTNIFSLGLGYAFQTKVGILNLSYANGKFENSPFSLDNSKVHVKVISYF